MGRAIHRGAALTLSCAVLIAAGPAGSLARAAACDLYPIALHARAVEGLAAGAEIGDIYNGVLPGNFGWLTWTGDGGTQVLVANLTPPGGSISYLNPLSAGDAEVSVGDWVMGRPGVEDSSEVRGALDALEGVEITVPVWDLASGTGSNSAYRVAGFALIELLNYRLPKVDRITARYIGLVPCDGGTSGNQAPQAGDDVFFIREVDSLYVAQPGVLANDRDPEGDPLRATLVTPPAHGSASLGANGAFFYTPDPAYVGIDSFTYRVSDGIQDSNIATALFYVRMHSDL